MRTVTQTLRSLVVPLWAFVAGSCCWGQADNDSFDRRIAVQGTTVQLDAYLLDASLQPGEPHHAPANQVTAKSLWWSWRAPISGFAAILPTGGSVCDQGVTFYTGASVKTLTRVDEVSSGVVPVTAETEYHLAVWSQCPTTTADLARFALQNVWGAGSDQFAPTGNYIGSRATWGRTIGFTGPEPGEPVHAGVGRGPSEWWAWQPAEDGLATVVLRGHGFSPALAAYVGDALQSLIPVSSQLTDNTWVWPAQRDRWYRVAIAGTAPDSVGVFRFEAALSKITVATPASGEVLQSPESLEVRLAEAPAGGQATAWWRDSQGLEASISGPTAQPLVLPAPPRGDVSVFALVTSSNLTYATPPIVVRVERPGDNMAAPLAAEGAQFDGTGDLGGATMEPGEPGVGGDHPASIWWEWTAPKDGTAYLEVTGAPQFSVFHAGAAGELTGDSLAVVPDFQDLRQLPVTGGVRYRLRAADPHGLARNVRLRLRLTDPPPNDMRVAAIELPLAGGVTQGNNYFATAESDEAAGWNSVWYRFTSPTNCVLTYQLGHDITLGSIRYPELSLFRETTNGTLFFLQHLTAFGPGIVSLDAGIGYRLSVGGPASRPMKDFSLRWGLGESTPNDRMEAAAELVGLPARFQVNLQNATLNEGENQAGLWWRWKAPRSGTATLAFSGKWGQHYDLSALVFRGPRETNSTAVNSWNPNEIAGTLAGFPTGQMGTTFGAEAGLEYYILVQSRYGTLSLPFAGEINLTSAGVKVTGMSPFHAELENYDPAIESPTAGVIYWSRPYFGQAEAARPPFQAEFQCDECLWFSVEAYLTNANGGLRVLRSPTLTLPRKNDEPAGATMLDPWRPRISDRGDQATYSNSDTAAMRVDFPGPSFPPPGSTDRGGGSLWYRWRAPFTGSIIISGGGVLGQLLFVDRRLQAIPNGGPREVTLPVVEGREYRLTVVGPSRMAGSWDWGLGFSYDFRFEFPAVTNQVVELEAPTSDLTVTTGVPVTFRAKLLSEPTAFGGVDFFFVHNFQGWVLSVPSLETNMTFTAPGEYRISARALRKDGSIVGPVSTRTVTVVPANDHFANRLPWPANSPVVDVRSKLATLEPGENSLTGATNSRSLWWSWSAPASGEAELIATGQDGVSRMAVYRGGDLATLERVSTPPIYEPPAQSNGYRSSLRTRFPMRAGEHYAIAYEAGYFDYQPTMQLIPRAIPENDQRQWAHRLTGNTNHIQAWNLGATRELGETQHAGAFGGRSVWYRWRAPADGVLDIGLGSVFTGPLLAVYDSGSAPVAAAAGATDTVSVVASVKGGHEYYLVVDGTWGAAGDFDLTTRFTATPANLGIVRILETDGVLELEATGAAGRTMTLWISEDFVVWEVLASGVEESDGHHRFRVPTSALEAPRFFRVSVAE